VSVAPVLHGAGTKRKLIQALMAGTAAVSTSLGAEGLDLRDGDELLLADDADAFAASIERLLRDDELWQRLAHAGKERVRASHGREKVRSRFLEVVERVLATPQRGRAVELGLRLDRPSHRAYERLVASVRDVVAAATPRGSIVLVASKGDWDLVRLSGYRGWHFPQTPSGTYAGEYPPDAAAAIAHIEELRKKGADYFLLPSTAFWWLDNYAGLREHLDGTYSRVWDDEACIVYRLRPDGDQLEGAVAKEAEELPEIEPRQIEELRPRALVTARDAEGRSPRDKVLAVGIYLAEQPNSAADVVSMLAETRRWDAVQRWIGVGAEHSCDHVAAVTTRVVDALIPKYELLNELLAGEPLDEYEFVLTVDDDIVLPRRFLDHYLWLHQELGFALSQPARTSTSYIDHPIVEQQRGAVARRTRFVEIGPVLVAHRSAYEVVFPFDLSSPMGWGYENVWAFELERRGLTLGIIDAVPVDHSLRPPVTNYKWRTAARQREEFLRSHEHLSRDKCMRVLAVVSTGER
jgi:Glycosyl transferases group 1